MVNLSEAVLVLTQSVTPPAVSLVDFLVQDLGDGNGPQIVMWNAQRLGQRPDAATLAGVTQAQVDAFYAARQQTAAQALLGDESPAGVALRAVYLAAGLTAQQVLAQLSAAVTAGTKSS